MYVNRAIVFALVMSLGIFGLYRHHTFKHTKQNLPHMYPLATGSLKKLPIFLLSSKPYNNCVMRVIALHPTSEVRVFGVKEAGDFVKQHCPNVYPTFMDLVPIAFKADIFRYCVLYTRGGIYIDDDVWLDKSLHSLSSVPGALIVIQDGAAQTLWQRQDNTYGIWNGLLIARRKHEYAFGCAMQLLIGRSATKMRHVKARSKLLAMTGPVLLGECLRPGSDATYVGFFQGVKYTTHAYLWSGERLFTHKKVPRDNVPHYSKLKLS